MATIASQGAPGTRSAESSRSKRERADAILPWVYLAPAMVALIVVGVYPVIYALWASVHQVSLINLASGTPWSGASNYVQAFTNSFFLASLGRTLLFLVIALPLELVIGLGVALVLDGDTFSALRGAVRVILVIPMAMTPVVVGLVGDLIFNEQFGVINCLLGLVHVGPVDWLGSPASAFITILVLQIWQWTPFVALILLAGLATVPKEIEEAMRLETNSWPAILRYGKLPYLLPGITAALIFQTAYIFKLFDMVFTLTGGGPGVATQLITLYVQRNAFRAFDIGGAAAQSIILLIVTIVLARIYIRAFYQELEA